MKSNFEDLIEIFGTYENTGDKEKAINSLNLLRDLGKIEYYKATTPYINKYANLLVRSEFDKICYLRSSSSEFKELLTLIKTNCSSFSKKEGFDAINQIYGTQYATINITDREVNFCLGNINDSATFSGSNKELTELYANLYDLKFNFSNVEADLSLLKEINPDGDLGCQFYFENDHIVFGEDQRASTKIKESLSSFLELFSKVRISTESLTKFGIVSLVAANLFSSVAIAGSKEVNDYIQSNMSKLKSGDFYTDTFLDNRRLLDLESQKLIFDILSKSEMHPNIKLISYNFDKKTNSGSFSIDFAGCKTTGSFNDGSPVEFSSDKALGSEKCFELMKGFERILSVKMNIILKSTTSIWANN